MIVRGYYDQHRNPCIKIDICGLGRKASDSQVKSIKVESIVDTGFTGFIQLPFRIALDLSLPFVGTQPVTFADGGPPSVMLTALARVTLADRTEQVVSLVSENSQEVLIGMDFLRRFDRALLVSKRGIFLAEESFLTKLDVPENG